MKFEHGKWYWVNNKKYIFINEKFISAYEDGKDYKGKDSIFITAPNDEYSETIYLKEASIQECE